MDKQPDDAERQPATDESRGRPRGPAARPPIGGAAAARGDGARYALAEPRLVVPTDRSRSRSAAGTGTVAAEIERAIREVEMEEKAESDGAASAVTASNEMDWSAATAVTTIRGSVPEKFEPARGSTPLTDEVPRNRTKKRRDRSRSDGAGTEEAAEDELERKFSRILGAIGRLTDVVAEYSEREESRRGEESTTMIASGRSPTTAAATTVALQRTQSTTATRVPSQWTAYRERRRSPSETSAGSETPSARSERSLASRDTEIIPREEPPSRERTSERPETRETVEVASYAIDKRKEPDLAAIERPRIRTTADRADTPRPVEFTTRGVLHGNPFEDITKFDGRSEKQHPMRFVGDFEKIAAYEGLRDRDMLHFFRLCIVGKAREWYDNQEFHDYGEAQEAFRLRYWGSTEQRTFRDKITNGTYETDRGDGRTPSEYVQKIQRDARYLVPPISELELIDLLKTHFDLPTYKELTASRITSVADMCRVLEAVERQSSFEAHMMAKRRLRQYEEEERARISAKNRTSPEGTTTSREYRFPRWSPRPARRSSSPAASSRSFSPERRISFSDERPRNRSPSPGAPWRAYGENSRTTPDKWTAPVTESAKFEATAPTRAPIARSTVAPRSREQSPRPFARARSSSPKDTTSKRDGSRDRTTMSTLRTDAIIAEVSGSERSGEREDLRTTSLPMTDVRILERLDEKSNARARTVRTRALLDTGAMLSAMVPELLRTCEREFARPIGDSGGGGGGEPPTNGATREAARPLFPTIKINKTHVRGAFNQKGVAVDTKVQLALELSDSARNVRKYVHEFYLIDSLYVPMILGADFIGRHGIAIRCATDLPIVAKKPTTEEPDAGESRLAGEPRSRERLETPGMAGETATGSANGNIVERSTSPIEEPIAETTATEDKQTLADRAEEESEFRRKLDELLLDNSAMLDGSLGKVKNYYHAIKVTNNRPYKAHIYPIPGKYIEEARRQIGEMENIGVIERAPTQFINPLIAVKKPNGAVRICLDARKINDRMENDHAQPPTIDEVLARVGQRRVFSKLDVSRAYWQIPLERDSRQYTGFLFDNQTYVYRRLPFGIKTAGASFTRAIESAMERANDVRRNVIVYLDDVLIASDDRAEHLTHLAKIFDALRIAGFKLNREKCEFGRDKISFLGHEISTVDVRINDATKNAIVDFPRPRNKREIQQFLGLANWDRRFVPRLAELAAPLEELLTKDAKFVWDSRRERAFNAVRQRIALADRLFLIDPSMSYGLETDASTIGLGARMYQYDDRERQYTVAYASRRLRGAELRYSVTELEALALVWSLRKWRVLLMGRTVRISTDHRALQFIGSCVNTSQRIARWLEFLQEFDLDIRYIPGPTNVTADVLSRNPSRKRKRDANQAYGIDSSDDEEEPSDPSDRYEWSREGKKRYAPRICMMADVTEGENVREWTNFVRRAQANRSELRAIDDDPQARAKYVDENGIVRANDLVWIPEDAAWHMLHRIHVYLAHFGTDKCVEFAKRYFAIENVNAIARDVVASCETCIATKVYTRPTRGPEYYDLPSKPGKVTSLDVYGPLPRSYNGCAYALVYLDHFSKYTKIYPTRDQKLDTIMHVTEQFYIRDVGRVPRAFLTDCGGQFITAKWKDFARRVGFAVKHTTPYNPQSNPVERVMREIGRVTRAYASEDHRKWDEILPRVEQIINATSHGSTGYTPAKLEDRERDLTIGPPEMLRRRALPSIVPTREQILQNARDKLREAAAKRRRQSEKTATAKPYESGDLVWIKSHRRSDLRHKKNRKLFPLYEGPFRIEREIKPNAYEVTAITGEKIGCYNTRQLRPHRSSAYRPEETPEKSPSEAESDANLSTTSASASSTDDYAPSPASSERSSEQDSGKRAARGETGAERRVDRKKKDRAATIDATSASGTRSARRNRLSSSSSSSSPMSSASASDDTRACAYRIEHGKESPLDTDDTIILMPVKRSRDERSSKRRRIRSPTAASPSADPDGDGDETETRTDERTTDGTEPTASSATNRQ